MKKAVLTLLMLVSFACAHRKKVDAVVIDNVPRSVAHATEPPVTSEPPSPSLVEAPPVVPPEQHESSGRFLQRIAHHTKVREQQRTTSNLVPTTNPLVVEAAEPSVSAVIATSPRTQPKPAKTPWLPMIAIAVVVVGYLALAILGPR